MPRIGLEPSFQNETFTPASADVEATAAAILADTGIEVGPDTAALITRRQAVEAQAAALRTAAALPVELYDLLDAIIAAVFDA